MGLITLPTKQIAQAFVKFKFSDKLNAIEDEDDRKALEESMVDYYTSEGGIDSSKDEVESYCAYVQNIVTNVTSAVASVTTAKIGPSVIVAGAATGVTNPAYMVALGASFKAALLSSLSVAEFFKDQAKDKSKGLGLDPDIVGVPLEALIETAKISVNTL